MEKKLYRTGIYIIAFLMLLLLTRLSGLLIWQVFLLLLPWFCLLVGLEWTKPLSDYSLMEDYQTDPIENLENPSRRYLWLNGRWDFRLAGETRWHRISIPHTWNTIPGLGFHTGAGIYRKLFAIPENWSLGKILLNFRGVNYRAAVSLDGRQIGAHEGGYTPFCYDITDRLRDSREKELEVEVSNLLARSSVPNVVGWRNEGGILREVYLETLNPIHISGVHITADPDLKGRAQITLTIKIDNPSLQPQDYLIEIITPTGASAYQHKLEGWTMQNIQHNFTLNFVSLWSTESPSLYTCNVTLKGSGEDYVVQNFGIKKVECRAGDIFLNGHRFKLRCIDRWEDFEKTGQVASRQKIEHDLSLIKEAGFNAIRLCPFPHHPYVLDACDRAGILVLEEIPVWKSVVQDMVNPSFQQCAEQQLTEMMLRDRNHPSVMFWGIANDVDSDTKEGRWFIERLAARARSLDPRPIYLVSGEEENEICADLVDIIAVSFRPLVDMDVAAMKTLIARLKERFPETPLLIVDYEHQAWKDADIKVGRKLMEEYQAAHLQQFIKFADESADAAGWSIASLSDHWMPAAFANPCPFFSLEGIVTHKREKKLSYGVIRKLLTENKESEIHLPRRSALPVTSFARITFLLALITGAVMFTRTPKLLPYMAYAPNLVPDIFPDGWQLLLFMTIFNALGWTVMINRFFRNAPQNLLGSIDMPFFSLISWLLRSEWKLFIWSYLTVVILWMYNVTMVGIALPEMNFYDIMNRTAVITLPDFLFVLAPVFHIRLWIVAVLFHLWKLYLAFLTLGPMGMLVYVIVGPILIFLVGMTIVELRFHILRYLRKFI
ncbi:MAG: glycoside hydrolase family 2 TIM barrel-domain containing protein [bacterium]